MSDLPRPYDRKIKHDGVWDRRLPTGMITTLENMRRMHEDHIADLAASIKATGQLAPILINRKQVGRNVVYELIAGYHRLEACIRVRVRVDCTIYDNLDPFRVLDLMQTENLHRSPDSSEWAEAIHMHFMYGRQNGLFDTIAQYCRKTGQNPNQVHNAIRFIEKLDERVATFVYEGRLSYGVATELARIEDPELQYRWAVEAIARELQYKEIRGRVSNYLTEKNGQSTLDGLFGSQKFLSYRELKHLIDPKLRLAAMAGAAYLRTIQELEEGGHLPSNFLTLRTVDGLTRYLGVICHVLARKGLVKVVSVGPPAAKGEARQ